MKTGGDVHYFVYLLAIYMDLGYLLAPVLFQTNYGVSGNMESRFSTGVPIPLPVFAYALALFHYLKGDELPESVEGLPPEIRTEFDVVFQHLLKYGHELREDGNLEAQKTIVKANKELVLHNYTEAIEAARLASKNAVHPILKADSWNLLGFAFQLNDQFKESIDAFNKAMELDPENGFPLTNASYSLLMLGQIEPAKELLEHAKARRLFTDWEGIQLCEAIIAHKQGFLDTAQQLFEELTKKAQNPVELLEFHFAQLLIDKGEPTEAIKVLKSAQHRKEPKVLDLLKELNQ